jgi:hypothetical protein
MAIRVSFVLPKGAVAGDVSVVGDFNGWDPFAIRCGARPQ